MVGMRREFRERYMTRYATGRELMGLFIADVFRIREDNWNHAHWR